MSADPTAPATSVRRPSWLDSAGTARSASIIGRRGLRASRHISGALAARGETPAAFGAPSAAAALGTPFGAPSAAAALGTPFGRRCIPAPTPTRWETRVGGPGADCVAPPSNIPDIAPHRAQDARWGPRSAVVAPLRRGPHGADRAPWGGSAGRLAALGATPAFHHGLLADQPEAPCPIRSEAGFSIVETVIATSILL